MSAAFKPIINHACSGPLTREMAHEAFDILFTGQATPAQIGGFLMALRTRGETSVEIAEAARVMREKSVRVTAPAGAIDIVGTGGDGKHTLNISTAAAFVVAGAGVPVAKHGNRNLSSRSGTADVQTELGINVMVTPEIEERCLREAGICFMMATMHHPAMKHVGPARVELGARTIFNALGPLTNPAGVAMQLSGAYSRELIRPMAETLRELGSKRAWLCHGGDGTDELSITGISYVAELKDGEVREFETHPEEFALPVHPFEELIGGDPSHNAHALRAALSGECNAYGDAVLMNAAAALYIAGRADSLTEGAEIARASIASGNASAALEALARITSRA